MKGNLSDSLTVPAFQETFDIEKLKGTIRGMSEREWKNFFSRLRQVNLQKLQSCKVVNETVTETLQTNAGLNFLESFFLQVLREELV